MKLINFSGVHMINIISYLSIHFLWETRGVQQHLPYLTERDFKIQKMFKNIDLAYRDNFCTVKGTNLVCASVCRAGASKVIGVECSQHLCDIAAETVIRNGYGRQCMVINKDVRRLTEADTHMFFQSGKADICVFEVRLQQQACALCQGNLYLWGGSQRNMYIYVCVWLAISISRLAHDLPAGV